MEKQEYKYCLRPQDQWKLSADKVLALIIFFEYLIRIPTCHSFKNPNCILTFKNKIMAAFFSKKIQV